MSRYAKGKGTTEMRRAVVLLVGGVAALSAHLGAGPVKSRAPNVQSANVQSAVTAHRGLVNQYCVTCHNKRMKTAGLLLDEKDLSNPGADAEVWEKVVRKLRGGLMPPVGRPRP